MRKICVTISARASYSRVYSMLTSMEKSQQLELYIVLIGSSVIDRYGNIYKEIKDEFSNVYKIHTSIEPSEKSFMSKTTGLTIIELSTFYELIQPDIVVTIADRFETIATSIAASYQNIPLAHIQGGEVTGNIDEKVRHANTKLADYHFVSNEKAYQRVVRLGENPDFIFNTGCPSLDIAKQVKNNESELFSPFKNFSGVGKEFTLEKRKYLVFLQHSETYSVDKTKKQIIASLEAIKESNIPTFIFWPNMDSGTDILSKELRRFRENNPERDIYYIKNLNPLDFLNLIKHSICLIGNSSCGIRECSFLGVPSINIGDRQAGRLKGRNVTNVNHDKQEIISSIQQAINKVREPENIYGDGESGKKISDIFEELDLVSKKRFFE